MVIIINGSLGIGKTSTAWALIEQFERAVMLDGDYIGAFHPFDFRDDRCYQYLYDTLEVLIDFHRANHYEDFVINYVFEKTDQLQQLVDRLKQKGLPVFCFCLHCSKEEHQRRIKNRNNENLDWELNRSLELNKILQAESRNGYLGDPFSTDNLSTEEVAKLIMKSISKN